MLVRSVFVVQNEADVPALDYGTDENHAIPDDYYNGGYGGYYPEHTVLPDDLMPFKGDEQNHDLRIGRDVRKVST